MAERQTTVEAAQEKIEEFADDLSGLLHSARTKAEGWLGQRQQVAKQLAEIRDTASHLLSQLGHSAAAAVLPTRRRRGPGRPKASKAAAVINKLRGAIAPAAAPKKRTMSAAARAAISAAQKARWAKVRAGKKKSS